MSRIDGYLRALETNRLDEYYEKKYRPMRKLHKFNKSRWRAGGQARATGRASTKKREKRQQKPK